MKSRMMVMMKLISVMLNMLLLMMGLLQDTYLHVCAICNVCVHLVVVVVVVIVVPVETHLMQLTISISYVYSLPL